LQTAITGEKFVWREGLGTAPPQISLPLEFLSGAYMVLHLPMPAPAWHPSEPPSPFHFQTYNLSTLSPPSNCLLLGSINISSCLLIVAPGLDGQAVRALLASQVRIPLPTLTPSPAAKVSILISSGIII
jgi:hypothetical protein